MANFSLFDLATINRADRYTGLIEDVTTLPREWDTVAAVPREGTWYEIAKRVTYPTAQFRKPNAGVGTSKSVYKKELKEMMFIDTILNVDEAIWDADDSSVGTIWMNEAEGAMRAAAILLGQQFYYGQSADANGFIGIRSQFSYVVKAGGTTNTTSAYLVWEDTKQGVRFDVGKNGSFEISAPMRQQVTDASSNPYFAYVGNLKGWVGLFVGSNLSVFAITGIGATATAPATDPITDALAQQLQANIPVARRNQLRWYMNRTAESILQQNRSAVTPTTFNAQYQPADSTGRPAYSPLPTMLNGWPIEVTDSILSTETNS